VFADNPKSSARSLSVGRLAAAILFILLPYAFRAPALLARSLCTILVDACIARDIA